MLEPITLIATAINWFKESKTGKLQIPGASQNVGEMAASKTGIAVMTIIGFSIDHIGENPESSAGWVMIGLCLLAVTLGDRIDKVYKIIKASSEEV